MIVAFLTAGCLKGKSASNSTPATTTAENTSDEKQEVVDLTINDGQAVQTAKVEFTEGMTAFDVLKKGTEFLGLALETKSYDFGISVEKIGDNQGGTDNKYWLYYVNDQPATVGADALKVKAADKIEFKFEASKF